jgi:hypothetical protein
METFLPDLKHSLRMFWQNRGFTAAAVAALALGIGANSAVFSVVNAVLLKPGAFPRPRTRRDVHEYFALRKLCHGLPRPNSSTGSNKPASYRMWPPFGAA